MTTKAKVVHKISNKVRFYHYEEWLTFQFAKELAVQHAFKACVRLVHISTGACEVQNKVLHPLE